MAENEKTPEELEQERLEAEKKAAEEAEAAKKAAEEEAARKKAEEDEDDFDDEAFMKSLLEEEEDQAKNMSEEEKRAFNKNAEEKRKRLEEETKKKKAEEEAAKKKAEEEAAKKKAEEEATAKKVADEAEAAKKKAEAEKSRMDKLGAELNDFVKSHPNVNLAELDKDKSFKKFLDGKILGKKTFSDLYEDFVEMKADMTDTTKETVAKNYQKSQSSSGPSVKGAPTPSDIFSEDELKRLSEKVPFMNRHEYTKIEGKLNKSIDYYDKNKK